MVCIGFEAVHRLVLLNAACHQNGLVAEVSTAHHHVALQTVRQVEQQFGGLRFPHMVGVLLIRHQKIAGDFCAEQEAELGPVSQGFFITVVVTVQGVGNGAGHVIAHRAAVAKLRFSALEQVHHCLAQHRVAAQALHGLLQTRAAGVTRVVGDWCAEMLRFCHVGHEVLRINACVCLLGLCLFEKGNASHREARSQIALANHVQVALLKQQIGDGRVVIAVAHKHQGVGQAGG